MKYSCVGFLELNSIARGIQTVDSLLKKASVEILFSYPASGGKYLIAFAGEVEDVKSAFRIGKEIASLCLLDSFLLPNIHSSILPCLEEKAFLEDMEAIGILETTTCASCILALDKALKTSKVNLVKLELAKGIGGKAYFLLEGEVGEVESAMIYAIRAIPKQNVVEKIVIPQATPSLLKIF